MTIELDEVVEMDDDALLPFRMDWSEWLAEEADTFLGTPTITVSPSGALAVASSPASPAYDGDDVVWWMSGGTAGTSYRITVHVTTTAGRVDERTVTVAVRER